MRGFLWGLILGAVLVVSVTAGLSLLVPMSRPDVASEPPVAVDGGADHADKAGHETGMTQPGADADLVEAAPLAPGAAGAGSDTLASMDPADTDPAEKPKVGAATGAMEGPGETAGAPTLSTSQEASAMPQAPGSAPDTPSEERGVPAASDPSQPSVPALPAAGSGFGTAPLADEVAPEVASHTDPDLQAVPPSGPGAEPMSEAAPKSEAAPEAIAEADSSPEPTSPSASAPRIAALPQAGTEGEAASQSPAIGTLVAPLTERDDAPDATPDAARTEPPAIERFAVPFENPEGQPLMSILLIDGKDSIGAEALADFPYPLTFAIDPAAPDAAEKMARHRAAGFEVVLLADLPAAALAQDAEVALSVWRAAVPEAVAILEGTGSGIQGSRALSDQVTLIAQDAGLGLIMQANGLNTAQKLAVRAGVPSTVVFRDFDGAGQSTTVMRRFLDQAAFRAGLDGAVIMLGRVQPDTISALLLWGLQDRAQRVALAPVSAVLMHEPGAE
ncbi:MAG: divergent polysaccharide deacetylase family protein [Pseudodonghicola sp.]|nr:divergent polysaccharide deacetylase family protein [Pseudodonghicola sp.]